MNKWLYMLMIFVPNLIAALLTFGAMQPGTDELWWAVPFPFVVAVITFEAMIYRMWSAIQGPTARMSPAAAAGLMLVPGFNLYWVFQVFPGFATDFNKLAEMRGLPAQISFRLMVATVACNVIPLVNLITQAMAISEICDGVREVNEDDAILLGPGATAMGAASRPLNPRLMWAAIGGGALLVGVLVTLFILYPPWGRGAAPPSPRYQESPSPSPSNPTFPGPPGRTNPPPRQPGRMPRIPQPPRRPSLG